MKKIIFSLALIISFSVQSQSWWGSKKVRGNGNVVTKTRTIDNFDRVSVGGSFDVILVDGKEGKLTIQGEENLLPYLITEVKGDKLKVKFKDNTSIKINKRFTVTIPFEDIESISLGGSGNVKVEKTIKAEDASFNIGGSGNITANVNAENIKASIGGSGNINLEGKSNNLKCSIAGSGNVKAYELQTDKLKANIAGSGDIRATVKTKIKANVVGSGSVYYKGDPKYIDTNSIGSGDVINRN